ncbi:MAG: hypothetical protein OEY20_02840 [Gemmatimonadota bacterium]|nr:hypothetical protein [Gemmatimonadota bacterium]MDH5196173.1 hypothetical protein [Gemmatimonadota bacterium]
MRRSLSATLAVAAVLTAACAAGGIRPSYEPFPDARVDTINAAPPDVIQEAIARVNAENMRGAWESPEEGFFETQWFNVATQQSGVSDRNNPDRVILLRFWADPIEGGRTKLVTEAIYQRTPDPSVQPRDREMSVPNGHAGDRLRARVIDGIKERFGR